MPDVLAQSLLTVALAEIGDKTQLLSLVLTLRFRQPQAIIAGILLATLLNHFVSAALGVGLVHMLTPDMTRWLVGLSFIATGLWLLVPDKDDDAPTLLDRYGAFLATTLLFFVVEIGDKTQVATVLLAARHEDILWVTAGTILGMLLANVPVVLAGERLMKRMPVRSAHVAACLLFVVLGLGTLLW